MNFKSFGNDPGASDNGGGLPPPGNYPLTRQGSVYSLTFDEFVSTMGGSGKDFGSMNMDELLKNIWTAEEVQTMGSTAAEHGGPCILGGGGGGLNHLQRQGSLTLPRTLSQKTVDEVWKDISKEYGSGSGSRGPNLAQTERQPTLGEMTLEEFLVRAGVVREDAQLAAAAAAAKPNDAVFGGLGMGYPQLNKVTGLMGNRIVGGGGVNNDPMVMGLQSPSTNLPLNINGIRSSNHQQQMQQQQQNSHSQQQQQQQMQQQQIFPKSYATQVPLASNQGIRGGIVGLSADQGMNGGNLVQGMVGVNLPPGPVHVPTGSPASQITTDKIGKSNDDTSSVSPVPYVFNGGLRGRKTGGPVEKVIERRQRRMIKNRESAARSRARKQAYTMELEAEVAKLKEENQELQKKQAEIMEIQKNQVMEMMNMQRDVKRRCLRRTLTGPW